MPAGVERFFDTNVLLYLVSEDVAHADRAEAEVKAGGVVSVQVLNEFASVARRKLRMTLGQVREVLAVVRAACEVVPITIETHDLGIDISERHRLAVYDGMIVASARLAGCAVLLSEDFNDGQRFGPLVIRDPFR
jgi:predicted nucleic acid-binding protein